MDSPPRDDSPSGSPPDDDRNAESTPDDDWNGDSTPDDRDTRERSDPRNHDSDRTDASPGRGTEAAGRRHGSEFDDPIGDLLPHATVDSRWWYWIAAIPLYVLVGAAFGLLFAVVALAGVGLGVDAGIVGFGLLFVLVLVLGLAGLVLTVVFPIATYVDARAVASSDASWTPDPLVWGLAALATVVLSAFTLSFVLAVYYLYKRHVAIGTP